MILVPMMRFGTEAADIEEHGGLRNNMMGWAQTSPTFFWLHAIFSLVLGALTVAVLVALVRLLWKKGNK